MTDAAMVCGPAGTVRLNRPFASVSVSRLAFDVNRHISDRRLGAVVDDDTRDVRCLRTRDGAHASEQQYEAEDAIHVGCVARRSTISATRKILFRTLSARRGGIHRGSAVQRRVRLSGAAYLAGRSRWYVVGFCCVADGSMRRMPPFS